VEDPIVGYSKKQMHKLFALCIGMVVKSVLLTKFGLKTSKVKDVEKYLSKLITT